MAKRFISILMVLLFTCSLSCAQEEATISVTAADFIDSFNSNVEAGKLLSIIKNGVMVRDTSMSWKLTMHSDLKATVNNEILTTITVKSGKQGSDNMEALLLFSYAVMSSNKYLSSSFDTALNVVLQTIYNHEYTINDILYTAEYSKGRGFTFNIQFPDQ